VYTCVDDYLETLDAKTWESGSWNCLDLWYIVSPAATRFIFQLLTMC
jgi:hypothetical protein